MGAAFLCAAVLAACGGGGGTPNPIVTTPPSPTTTPSPSPNPYGCVGSSPFAVAQRKPMVAAPHPIAPGDTFAYTGTIATTYTQSSPCPQPAATSSATVSSTVTDYATTGPGAATTDQRSVETDSFPAKNVVTTTDLALANTASAFDLFQATSADDAGNTTSMTFTNPQQLDVNPAAAATWGGNATNNPAGTYTETLADGTSVSRNVAPDGSYVDNETYADGSTATITVDGQATGLGQPNGAGSYAFNGIATTIAYGAPQSGSISLTLTSPSGTANRTYPVWFAMPVPSSLISDTFSETLNQTIPASCNLNASYGTAGNQVVETYTVLDPVLGDTETRTTTTYNVDGYGAVCVTIDDTLNSFYDYSGDTTVSLYYSHNGQPNSVDHITETLTISAPGSTYPQSRTKYGAARGISPVAVASRIASIQHLRETQRAQRAERLHQALLLTKEGSSK